MSNGEAAIPTAPRAPLAQEAESITASTRRFVDGTQRQPTRRENSAITPTGHGPGLVEFVNGGRR